jgi:hypothetical protein
MGCVVSGPSASSGKAGKFTWNADRFCRWVLLDDGFQGVADLRKNEKTAIFP